MHRLHLPAGPPCVALRPRRRRKVRAWVPAAAWSSPCSAALPWLAMTAGAAFTAAPRFISLSQTPSTPNPLPTGPLRPGLPKPTLSNLPQDPAARASLADNEKVKGNESMRAGDFEVRPQPQPPVLGRPCILRAM